MLNNLLTKFAQVKSLPMKVPINLHGLNWCEYEKTWLLIYFSTSWCAPCQKMAPMIDDVSARYGDHLHVIKIDVDEQTQLAKQLKVTGVPTLVLVNQTGTKSHLIGGVSADEINHWLDEQLNQNVIK
jgi:thioredoxin 1